MTILSLYYVVTDGSAREIQRKRPCVAWGFAAMTAVMITVDSHYVKELEDIRGTGKQGACHTATTRVASDELDATTPHFRLVRGHTGDVEEHQRRPSCSMWHATCTVPCMMAASFLEWRTR